MFGKVSLVLFSFYIVTSGKETLQCVTPTNIDSVGCICEMVYKPNVHIPYSEAKCEYLGLEEIPDINSPFLLNSIDLSHNNINELKTEGETFQSGDMIFSLKFCHNRINYIADNYFVSFQNLTTLDLSHNDLKALEPKTLDKLRKLEFLDLSFNEISSIPNKFFGELKNLKTLNMSYNNLFDVLQKPTALTVNLGINENILHLSLNNVGVTKIHTKCWNSFKAIEYLSVADNPLTEIPQTPVTLKYLDISGTNITDIHENYLQYINLKVLKMSRIQNLTFLSNYSFYNLGSLEEFVLSDSPNLTDFNEFVFGLNDKQNHLRSLRKLDLARNNLKTLNETYEYLFRDLEDVDISFNPWNCDCDLMWLEDVDFTLKNKENLRCASPDNMVNKMVLKMLPKDIPNCYPGIYGKKSHQTALLVLTMVVFCLIIIIIYLCLYSPRWAIQMTRRKVSPDSPYSINNEQM